MSEIKEIQRSYFTESSVQIEIVIVQIQILYLRLECAYFGTG